jgi:hypothetical protein
LRMTASCAGKGPLRVYSVEQLDVLVTWYCRKR